MSKTKDLVKNTGIIGIGKLSSQIVTFLLLPLYTSILSSAEYGTVDLILSYIQLLLPIVNLQLDQALFRFLVNKREDRSECRTIISTMAFFSVIQLVVYIGIFGVVQLFIDNRYKWFFLLNIICSVYSSFMSNCSRGRGHNMSYSIQSFIGVLMNILLNILFLVFVKMGANGMLLASALSSVCSGTYGLFSNKAYSFFSLSAVDRSRIKEFYAYSVPLIPNQLSWWIMKASDKTVINIFVSIAANGLIAVASKFSSAYIMVYNLFNMAWAESVVLHINDKDGKQYIEKTVNSTFNIFFCLCISVISFMPFVYRFFVPNAEYSDAYGLIPIYMTAVFFNVIVGLYSALYVANKDTKAIAVTSGVSAAVNITADLMLVGVIGVYAAPVSTALGFAVIMVYRYFHSRKYMVVKLEMKNILGALAVGSLVIALYYINYTAANILSAAVSVAYALIFNRDIIKSCISTIKKRAAR
ncbi:MAG: polysaccharide biosynthesis C-terminal domain-containing protein [Ruminococcus sp.]|uniref:lipopolysaccharide biosynthesis protein n=1 Tax=Ruminococcus sp. TaxID=41978 RepID=UPI0025CCFC20|nr:oligosaccharide flippase family protein [Ruminococcus sp.]MCR5600155.1 polysaccharide biosynthesis C-terminal domain-containing protein [Ruminococcus sp.]